MAVDADDHLRGLILFNLTDSVLRLSQAQVDCVPMCAHLLTYLRC